MGRLNTGVSLMQHHFRHLLHFEPTTEQPWLANVHRWSEVSHRILSEQKVTERN